ncbi:hypothetical protein SNE40_009726 [Patella caerulea]|uniref:Uncharacterized protein n=1 Tax=Patella caerulea TaxID=87958 RepID=A0AAN8Q3M2_PATCE
MDRFIIRGTVHERQTLITALDKPNTINNINSINNVAVVRNKTTVVRPHQQEEEPLAITDNEPLKKKARIFRFAETWKTNRP